MYVGGLMFFGSLVGMWKHRKNINAVIYGNDETVTI